MVMSKNETGRLGAEVSNKVKKQQKEERVASYNANPKLCGCCGNSIPYEKRVNKFCSSSCSATITNAASPKRKKADTTQKHCLNCSKKVTKKYCNAKCQQEHSRKLTNERVKNGEAENSGQVKKYLLDTSGNVCSKCGISEWNNEPIVMELEHKDGDSDNNKLENCCLLCPNCHSQTPTYKNRNKGNGRAYRRQRYAEGKSY